jgi:hypothetical protein
VRRARIQNRRVLQHGGQKLVLVDIPRSEHLADLGAQ